MAAFLHKGAYGNGGFGIEKTKNWSQPKLFGDLCRLQDFHEPLDDPFNDPPTLLPNRATRQHRQWWARREISFPLFFGIAYLFFFFWALEELMQSYLR
ncbi:MAG: hypothetical protein M3Q07_08180 [Pseudobdellovibrionaceae bacterium]|nr:hypothetical protein [Pseudobdellovibrionaceae bacterium]